MNEGHGDLPTEESLAQAVAELAHVVAANEAKAPESFVADLLPHAERLRRFAAADGAPGGREAAVTGGRSELSVKEPT